MIFCRVRLISRMRADHLILSVGLFYAEIVLIKCRSVSYGSRYIRRFQRDYGAEYRLPSDKLYTDLGRLSAAFGQLSHCWRYRDNA